MKNNQNKFNFFSMLIACGNRSWQHKFITTFFALRLSQGVLQPLFIQVFISIYLARDVILIFVIYCCDVRFLLYNILKTHFCPLVNIFALFYKQQRLFSFSFILKNLISEKTKIHNYKIYKSNQCPSLNGCLLRTCHWAPSLRARFRTNSGQNKTQ